MLHVSSACIYFNPPATTYPPQRRLHGCLQKPKPFIYKGLRGFEEDQKNLRKCSIREQIDDFLRNLHVVDFSAISCSGYDGTFLLDDAVDVFVDCP